MNKNLILFLVLLLSPLGLFGATQTSYQYSITASITSQLLESTTLANEIQASAIVTAFSHINSTGDIFYVWFKDPISGGDKTILDAIVLAHKGEPIVGDELDALNSLVSQKNLVTSVFKDVQTANRVIEVAESFVYPQVYTDRIATFTSAGGIASISNQQLFISTSVAPTGQASAWTKHTTTYIPGRMMYALFTPTFTAQGVVGTQTGILGSTQQVGFFTNNFSDGFGLELKDNGHISIIHRQASSTILTVDQNNFNGDKCDGSGASGFSWDLTKINIIEIRFGYLGTAPIEFWINGGFAHGGWILFHKLDYPNMLTRPHVANTNLGMWNRVIKTSGVTDIIMTATCWSAGFIGNYRDVDAMTNTHFISRSAIILQGIFAPDYLMTIRNPLTYKGSPNHYKVRLKRFSIVGTNDKEIAIRVYKNATITGIPVFNPRDGNNGVIEFDIAGIGTTLGELVSVSENAGKSIGGGRADIELLPGETLSFISTTKTADPAAEFFVKVEERF